MTVPKLRFPEFRDAPEWGVRRLADLFTIGNGRDYKHLAKGNIPVYGTGGYMLSVDDCLYDGESVCIGRKGTIDKPMFLSGKFWTVDTLFYTHSFKGCLPKFIFSIFQNVNWIKHNEAGGVPSLSKANIEKIEVAIPKPEEQQKIADCLSSIDELINAQTKKIEALKNHKKGLMQQLFPAEGEALPKLRFPEFRDAAAWKENLLGKLFHDRQEVGYLSLQLLSLTHKEGVILQEDSNRKNNSSADKTKYLRVCTGDIVYNTMRMWEGRSALVGLEGLVSPAYTVCQPSYQTNSLFFSYYFKTHQLIKQFHKYSQGLVKDTLNLKFLAFSKIPVPIPSAVEQQKIADCLSSINELINVQTQKIEALKNHKKGLMQQLFPAVNEIVT